MSIETASYILATAGHVDHGKSALVRALTGTDPDRLPEEKRRGITIDLGFASLALAGPTGTLSAGIVDVPGHEDFVKNMVAGVGSVDAALLVVAADDGWMPQTEEHLQILSYLGVTRGVVALTKVDLVADAAAALEAVRNRLRGTFLQDAPIVPTAATVGRGIAELKTALAAMLAGRQQKDLGRPRAAVDRVFSLRGVGTIVTGTLTGGKLTRGQAVVVQPGGRPARIRSLQNHHREVKAAGPGSRVAMNLPDLVPTDGSGQTLGGTVGRGDVIAADEAVVSSRVIDVMLERSGRRCVGADKALISGSLVDLHLGSAMTAARVRLLDRAVLAAGQQSLARIKLKKPLAVAVGDRFVIRNISQEWTVCGGVVVDARPRDAGRRVPRDVESLRQRAQAIEDAAVFVATTMRMEAVAERAGIGAGTRFSQSEIDAAVERLNREGKIASAGELLVELRQWQDLLAAAVAAVDQEHQAHPERSGVAMVQIAKLAAAATPRHATSLAGQLGEAVIAEMSRGDFLRSGATIRRRSHRISLPSRLQPAAQQIRARLAERPFDPPSRKELAGGDVPQQALRFLIASGEVVEIAPEVVMSAEAYAAAKDRIANGLRQRGRGTVSELKSMLESSRRIMVPLLEKLDREGFTRREGDYRVWNAAASVAKIQPQMNADTRG